MRLNVRLVPYVLVLSCTGQVSQFNTIFGANGDSPAPVSPPAQAPASCMGKPTATHVPLQRLSRWQLENLVKDVFGDSVALPISFPATNTRAAEFSTFPEGNSVGDAAAKGMAEAAEFIALALSDSVPACGAADEAGCARAEFFDKANKLFRRAATAAEVEPVVALFASLRPQFTYQEAVALGFSSLLQHPQTLYAFEAIDGALDAQALAQRMALLYRSGAADAQLLSAAQTGALETEAGRLAEATRLLATPRGKLALGRFIFEWLTLEGFEPDSATQFDRSVHVALLQELQRLVEDAVQQPNQFEALLTSPRGFVNVTLEGFYGLPHRAMNADGWRAVEFSNAQRVGLLTHPLLMAKTAHGKEASAILRGKFVRTKLLCGELPPPPAGATTMQPDVGPNPTARSSSEARMKVPACTGCHRQMDPIGFGFLQFDGAGRYQPQEDGQGEVLYGGDADGSFTGVRELGERLSRSEAVAQCVSSQWFRYAFGKKESDSDTCTVKTLSERFVASGKRLDTLFASLAALEAFATRKETP